MLRGKYRLCSRGMRSHAELQSFFGRAGGIRWLGGGPWPFLLLAALSGCDGLSKPAPPAMPTLDPAEIVMERGQVDARPFGVDVFLDATSSMEGFAAAPDSTYLRFLEDLEGSLVSGVKHITDVRYFKFGETLREVARQEFRNARNAQFYHEPGIFRDTNIELILRRRLPEAGKEDPASPPGPRVTLAITDLFQKDQDVNIVVQQIKAGCLADRDCSVAVLAIPSAFDGMIHDSRGPSYRYRSASDPESLRPFYLLMFGPESQLLHLGEVLSANKYVDLENFLVMGPRIVKSFQVRVARDSQAEGVTPRKSAGAENEAVFNLRKGFAEAKLKVEAKVEVDRRAFGIEPAKIFLRAYRQEGDRRIPADSELRLGSISGPETLLSLDLNLHPPEKKGIYTYVGELELGNVNSFRLPAWIARFSSDNPTRERDAARTLNLDRLLERLIAAGLQQDQRQTKLAHFRIQIHRL